MKMMRTNRSSTATAGHLCLLLLLLTRDTVAFQLTKSANSIFSQRRIHHGAIISSRSSETTIRMTAAIGFIGLGIMGEGMAARLITENIAGQSEDTPLIIWNRTGSKCTAFQERFPDKHIIIKESAKDVIEASGTTFSILSTPEASKSVFEGDDGVLAGVSEGKCIVDCATLAEEDMKRMDSAITAKGGTFLEAPVSGSKGPAATGTLIFLCAGSKEIFSTIETSHLAAMGKASHFFSEEVGYGTRAKLVVNSLMGTMMAAYGEGLALAGAVGLDCDTMIEVISQGAIASPMYALKGPKMVKHDHAPNFPLKHAHKDMKLASDLAKSAGVEFSVMDQAEAVFREAREDKDLNVADEDFSAVFEKVLGKSKK
mmetsp:Transcript_1607/g.2357  ORF Transcript_1607/g.2357 Transcript_1607/m.2357 type:complete len:371 (-) Transcript_1607:51-1163(-)